jgi:hypothetical protein
VSVVVAPRLGYKYDSPGGYDSIFLVETFRALTALADLPADYSEEHMDAGSWPPQALSATGVKFVVTWQPRPDLELVKTAPGLWMYRVANPAPRAKDDGGNAVNYFRPSSDEILIRSASSQAGFVYVLEADDPGWSAQVDGISAPITEANPLGMAIPVAAGNHAIRLRYHTPGRMIGVLLSLLSVGMLGALVWTRRHNG